MRIIDIIHSGLSGYTSAKTNRPTRERAIVRHFSYTNTRARAYTWPLQYVAFCIDFIVACDPILWSIGRFFSIGFWIDYSFMCARKADRAQHPTQLTRTAAAATTTTESGDFPNGQFLSK